jgi:hypothetical protein
MNPELETHIISNADYQIHGMEMPVNTCDYSHADNKFASWRRGSGVVRFERGGRAGTRRFSFF